MTQLKTLKDLPLMNYGIEKHDLRQEAIKWIKWFDNNSNTIKIFNKDRSSDLFYTTAKNPDEIEKIEREKALEKSCIRQQIRNWIKHFFNITDSDLAEGK